MDEDDESENRIVIGRKEDIDGTLNKITILKETTSSSSQTNRNSERYNYYK